MRQGRGTALVSRDGKGRGNADKSGKGDVETGRLCSGKRLFFMAGRVWSFAEIYRLVARGSGTDSSGSRGGAGTTIEGKQKAFVPPPRNASPAFGRLRRPPAALRAAPRAGASPVLQTSPRGTAPPGSRNCPFPARAGEISCITTIQSSRAMPAETPVSDPRGCRVIIFHDAIPARCPK